MTDFAVLMTSIDFSDEDNFESNYKINKEETICVNHFF